MKVTASTAPAPVLTIERLAVRSDRVEANVRVAPGAHMTTPALVRRAVAAFPDLPRHACVNDAGPTFAAVMEATPLPHLLEHLVISLQVRDACTPEDVALVGTTEWLDEAAGLARVEVSFTDDLVALRAFRDAAAFLNGAVLP